jgi:hypothetical protein
VTPQGAQAHKTTNKYRNEILQDFKASNEPGLFTLLNGYGALWLGSTYTVINAHSARLVQILSRGSPDSTGTQC